MTVPLTRSSVMTLVSASALGLTLTACATATGAGGEIAAPRTSLSQYALQVEPGLDRIALAVHAGGEVSPTQRAALADLARRFVDAGGDILRVQAPTGEDADAGRATWAIREVLTGFGLSPERVVVGAYEAPSPRAPVLAGFETVRASIPDCAAAGQDRLVSWSNRPDAAFGCSVNANLAAQIAQPRDIAVPRTMTPSDQGRMARVFNAYRQGEITSAQPEPRVEGRISRAVD